MLLRNSSDDRECDENTTTETGVSILCSLLFTTDRIDLRNLISGGNGPRRPTFNLEGDTENGKSSSHQQTKSRLPRIRMDSSVPLALGRFHQCSNKRIRLTPS